MKGPDMTGCLRHINLLSWKDGTTQAAVDALGAELQRMAGEIPEVRALSYGPDLGMMGGNADFVISEEFDDSGAFRRYLAHPAHERMIRDFLRPILASRHAIQVTVPPPGPAGGDV
jgi:hypothetical protein